MWILSCFIALIFSIHTNHHCLFSYIKLFVWILLYMNTLLKWLSVWYFCGFSFYSFWMSILYESLPLWVHIFGLFFSMVCDYTLLFFFDNLLFVIWYLFVLDTYMMGLIHLILLSCVIMCCIIVAFIWLIYLFSVCLGCIFVLPFALLIFACFYRAFVWFGWTFLNPLFSFLLLIGINL